MSEKVNPDFESTDVLSTEHQASLAQGPAVAISLGGTAGTMLRRAREAAGISPAALAAILKVTEKKLAALEEDRYADLPDLGFARALSKSICKYLKVDSEPVMSALPVVNMFKGVEHSDVALNMPYQESSAPFAHGWADLSWVKKPVVLATAGVVLVIAALMLMPKDWIQDLNKPAAVNVLSDGTTASGMTPAQAPTISEVVEAKAQEAQVAAQSAASVVAVAPLPEQTAAAPSPVGAAAPAVPSGMTVADAVVAGMAGGQTAPAADAGANGLQLRAKGPVWVGVKSGKNPVFSKEMQAGEVVNLEAQAPVSIRVGVASALEASYRGQSVDVTAFLRRDGGASIKLD